MKNTTPQKKRELWIGDNLTIMRDMNSDTVDLIYLDPPFNAKKKFQGVITLNGKKRIAQFKDTWTVTDITEDEYCHLEERCPKAAILIKCFGETHGNSWKAYLTFMGARLVEMRRLLKDTGSIYLHCDSTMSHAIKLLMDSIFGTKNFRNEIIWCYKSGGAPKTKFAQKHHTIYFYTKTDKWDFNYDKEKSYGQSGGGHGGKVKYYKDSHGTYSWAGIKDWWPISMIATTSHERIGWPTQKPLELLERIIKSSSNENSVVLDPFCGCATACVSSEMLNRQWIGIDLELSAAAIMQARMSGHKDQNLLDNFEQCKIYSINPKPSPKTQDEQDLLTDLLELESIDWRTSHRRTDIKELTTSEKEHAKEELYYEQKKKCNGCRNKKERTDLELDRIIPEKRGGYYIRSNVQLLCSNCNRRKGGGTNARLTRILLDDIQQEAKEREMKRLMKQRPLLT